MNPTFAVNNSKKSLIQSHPDLIKLNKLRTDKPDDYEREFVKLQKRFRQETNKVHLMNLYRIQIDYLNDLDNYDSLISTIHYS
jgi:hypothetical protein